MDAEKDELVWCKAACGNNLHAECLEQWAASRAGKAVTCVYWYASRSRDLRRTYETNMGSRTQWEADEAIIKKVKTTGNINDEGYVNVGAQLGLSGTRGISPPLEVFWGMS